MTTSSFSKFIAAANASPADDDELIDSSETAQLLGLKNPHTLEVWRSTKRHSELEYVKIGRLVKYRRGAIRRFIELRTVYADGGAK